MLLTIGVDAMGHWGMSSPRFPTIHFFSSL